MVYNSHTIKFNGFKCIIQDLQWSQGWAAIPTHSPVSERCPQPRRPLVPVCSQAPRPPQRSARQLPVSAVGLFCGCHIISGVVSCVVLASGLHGHDALEGRHAVTCVSTSFSIAVWYSFVGQCDVLLIHSRMDGYLGCSSPWLI